MFMIRCILVFVPSLLPPCFQGITAHLHAKKSPPYVINLDPAVHEVAFPANIGMSYSLPNPQYSLGLCEESMNTT